MKRRFAGRMAKWALIGATCVTLSACAATYRNHGWAPTDEELSEIVVGVDTRASVEETIGVPSTAGILDSSGYYYVKSRIRHFGAMRPKEIEREVLAISFSESGVVRNIERFSLADGRIVPLSRRVTTSSVQGNGLLRQLLGSIGRFAPSQFGS